MLTRSPPKALLLLLLCIVATSAFSSTLSSTRLSFGLGQKQTAKINSAIDSTSSIEITSSNSITTDEKRIVGSPSSWEELTSLMEKVQAASAAESSPAPLVTLYRDTNGWCPFCERVWLALHIKKIPYQEVLVNLQNKPDWFLAMVPTGLVPAVLFHDDLINADDGAEKDDDAAEQPPERRLVWESLDIMKELDKSFPQTPQLVREDDEDYMEAREIATAMTTAGFQYIYAGRNKTLTEEDKAARKNEFNAVLDKFDDFLGKGGPFVLGADVSGIDVEIVPVMERWRYQLPLTNGMDITDDGRRKFIQQWYDSMDDYEPYINRVKGDEYSWTAVASTFLRFFGGAGGDDMTDEMKEAIERADSAAEALTEKFVDDVGLANTDDKKTFLVEAASKILSNHEGIVSDCTNTDPKSQKDMARAKDADAADCILRAVVQNLLTQTVSEEESMVLPEFEDEELSKDAILSARTVASRLCVPRDMGGPAASLLRSELTKTANSIEETLSQ